MLKIFILFFVGFFISCFSLNNALISIFFSIPFTKKLDWIKVLLDYESIINMIKLTITLNLVITIVISFLITLFCFDVCLYYYLGMLICFLLSFNKLGENENNLSDYFQTYNRFIDVDKIKEAFNS